MLLLMFCSPHNRFFRIPSKIRLLITQFDLHFSFHSSHVSFSGLNPRLFRPKARKPLLILAAVSPGSWFCHFHLRKSTFQTSIFLNFRSSFMWIACLVNAGGGAHPLFCHFSLFLEPYNLCLKNCFPTEPFPTCSSAILLLMVLIFPLSLAGSSSLPVSSSPCRSFTLFLFPLFIASIPRLPFFHSTVLFHFLKLSPEIHFCRKNKRQFLLFFVE